MKRRESFGITVMGGREEIESHKKLSLRRLKKKEIFPFGCVTLISSPLVIWRFLVDWVLVRLTLFLLAPKIRSRIRKDSLLHCTTQSSICDVTFQSYHLSQKLPSLLK
jgi:hypothetical protein